MKQAFALAILLIGLSNQFPALVHAGPEANPQELDSKICWGEKDKSGLQMGIWQAVFPASTICCVIKNQGEQTVRFNDEFMDYYEGTAVWAKQKGDTGWIMLKRGGPVQLTIGVFGTNPSNRITLLPGESHLAYAKKFPLTQTPFPPNSFIAQLRSWEGPSLNSFIVSLSNYAWPPEWKGMIEIKVVQKLPNFPSPFSSRALETNKDMWSGTLESGVVEANMEQIK